MACVRAIALVLLMSACASGWNGQVKISPSRGNPYRGRLEFMWHYRWGTVCNDYFLHRSARVVCRQLNLIGGWRVGHYNHHTCRWLDSRYMCGTWRAGCPYIWLDNVWCRGNERRLMDCRHLPYGWHNCHHYEDVMVQCHPPPLWMIEWEFQDEEEKGPYKNGHVAHYGVQFNQAATPNVLNKCWPWWRLTSKVKVLKYTNDFNDAETPSTMVAHIHRWGWPMGWKWDKGGALGVAGSNPNRKRSWYPGLYFDVSGEHCDMERVRAVQCDYKGAKITIELDKLNSYCWESKPRVPNELQQVFLQTGHNLSNGSTLNTNFTDSEDVLQRRTPTAPFHGIDGGDGSGGGGDAGGGGARGGGGDRPVETITMRVPMANIVRGHLGPAPHASNIVNPKEDEHLQTHEPTGSYSAKPTSQPTGTLHPLDSAPPGTHGKSDSGPTSMGLAGGFAGLLRGSAGVVGDDSSRVDYGSCGSDHKPEAWCDADAGKPAATYQPYQGK